MSNPSKITALVINLNNAKKRWEFQQKQLDKLGIEYQRWEANSVDSLTNDDYEKWANDWQRKLRRTEVACFLSHYGVWQRIAKSNQTYLVLEDDAVLSQSLTHVLTAISELTPFPFDHLSFETRGRKKLYSKKGIDLTETIKIHYLYVDKSGAAAYLLTPKGAQILLDAVEQSGAGLADALLCHTKNLNSTQTVPALALQMDMAEHYGMSELQLNLAAASNISTPVNRKPQAEGLVNKFKYKSRRINAQLIIGMAQLNHQKDSNYLEVQPNKADFDYLKKLIIKVLN